MYINFSKKKKFPNLETLTKLSYNVCGYPLHFKLQQQQKLDEVGFFFFF